MKLSEKITSKRQIDPELPRKIVVEKWSTDEEACVIYCTKLSGRDLDRLTKKHKGFLSNQTIDGMIDLILMKAQDANGEKVFGLEDKQILLDEEISVIAEIAAQMFADVEDLDDIEKN